ncbi:MAG: sensor histidine kinase [Clostridiaceae bacterium]|nr:sensor histidine kinase [Clostridiaceae bacterium]
MGILMIQFQIANTNIPLTKNLNQQVITAKAEELGGWIDKRISELRILTETEELSSMDKENIRPFMFRMDRLHKKDYESFAIVDLNGNAWVTNDTYIDISQRPYFKEIQQSSKNYAISDPILSHSNQEPIIVIIHKIYGKEGNLVGYINGAIYLENFSRIAEEIEIYDGKAWLVDSKCNLFTTRGDPHEEWINLLNLASLDYKKVDNLKDDMIAGKKGIQVITAPEGQEKIVIYAPIPYTNGWSLGIDFSKSLMTADTDNLIYTVLFLGIAVMIMLVFVSWMLAKSITEPIIHLQKKMAIVEKGNLNVSYNSTRKDEIGQLGRSFNRMIQEIKHLSVLFKKEQKEKRQAELKILHAQVQPHFLYNTLDTIRWSVLENETQQSVELLEALSTYYRIGLSRGEEFITLEKELDHIECYLQLLKARYEEKLEYSISYDENLLECVVLKLILQPIVENAIIHGFNQKSQKVFCIHIQVEKRSEHLEIMIQDQGDAIDLNKLKEIQNCLGNRLKPGNELGFGLYSTNRRIQLTYGKSYGLSFERIKGSTIVKIKHPFIRKS